MKRQRQKKQQPKVFIGGAWPYANSSLHIGHIAALLPGDVIARYYRKAGANVLYVSGTDAHGTPITLRAREEQVSPNEIANRYHEEFCDCFERLQFSYDKYISTDNVYHADFVKTCIQKLYDNGYIYEKEEPQDYCDNCEQFLSDREIVGTCPICGGHATGDQCDDCLTSLSADELQDKHCKYCGHPVAKKSNTHLYWKLSHFQDDISNFVSDRQHLWRFNAINESKKYLDEGLKDRAISRSLDWGIDIPISGYEDKKVYVWIEAVLGYISAGKLYCEQHGLDWESFYKSPYTKTYYVHGKDNIPFHTIIYPGLLLSLKDRYQLPEYIISSEYLNVNDEKISKSKGNGVTAKDVLDRYDSDTIRYYILSHAPEKKDANFSYELLEQVHNKKLVGEYANFVNRNLAFLIKKFDGITPIGSVDPAVQIVIENTYAEVGALIAQGELKTAISKVADLVQYANKYYDEQRPWILVKENLSDFNDVTATCLDLIVNIANLYEPFIPKSSHKVFSFFGLGTITPWHYLISPQNVKLQNVSHLFERI